MNLFAIGKYKVLPSNREVYTFLFLYGELGNLILKQLKILLIIYLKKRSISLSCGKINRVDQTIKRAFRRIYGKQNINRN
ncbi:hypothetical protein CVD27_21425 [Neobacillus cucumis]|uniref:Uncharacterized protein n=1 Tax=Neobacillus cucumis TaxID=1740721 RepID=A0A2N5H9D8_9BACI|nr:hypothetical protein CVD27_21425 [Neobacillus cucumis]